MDRVRPIIEMWIHENGGRAGITAAQMGVSERRLYNLMKEQDCITEYLLDHILARMDHPELWYTELADLMS